MRTASRSRFRRGFPVPGLFVVVACVLAPATPLRALDLDDNGAFRLGLRSYTAVRFGSQQIGDEEPYNFPGSGAGHLRQHRYFLQLDLEHDLLSYARSGHGLARALGWANLDLFKYSLTYRGEREGIYDYGPSEYSHYRDKLLAFRRKVPA